MINKTIKKLFSSNGNFEKEILKLDFYSILNVGHHFKESELRKSYFKLAKEYHPDKYKGGAEIFRRISEAYNTLKDPVKREEYNRKLKIKYKSEQRRYSSMGKGAASDSTKETEEEEQTASKYEEDFKKINLEKEAFKLFSSKIRTNPENLKTFKTELEKKMSKREFVVHSWMNEMKIQQRLNKDLIYQFHKVS